MNVRDTLALFSAIGLQGKYNGLSGTGSKHLHRARQVLSNRPHKAEWSNSWDKQYLSHPPVVTREMTYERCVDWRLYATGQDDNLVLKFLLVMWNGDMLYGEQKDRRCEWEWELQPGQPHDDMFCHGFEGQLMELVHMKADHDEMAALQKAHDERVQARVLQFLKQANVEAKTK